MEVQGRILGDSYVDMGGTLNYLQNSIDTGEDPFMGIVAGIIPGLTTLVSCVEDERLDFQASTDRTGAMPCRNVPMESSQVPPCLSALQDGQQVAFTEVKGMPEISGGKAHRIRNCKVRTKCARRSAHGFLAINSQLLWCPAPSDLPKTIFIASFSIKTIYV